MFTESKGFPPSDILKPYIKYYWVCTCDESVSMEVMYPSGHVELCIDISNGNTVRHRGDSFAKVPNLEVLGHLTTPTRATVTKGTTLLVARFYSCASALFFPDQISNFTNGSIDLYDILNKESTGWYDQLMDQHSLAQKIKVLDSFLIRRLLKSDKKTGQFKLVEELCNHIYKDDAFSIENLASHYGFSERYVQRLFLEWVGLTPKSFHSVQRFNKSLELIQSSESSLTSIALECGYYDQAHFIKEFKSYAGITPSQAARLHEPT
ncbi:MAG: helix-turn-helix transcriptional regulator [Bacteroidetes bacterium]|nr:helix-turn-helix transcriptional regulator [Bacteroidota bacterium]